MKNMQQLDLFTRQVSEETPTFNPSAIYFQTPEDLEFLLSRLNVVDVGLFYLGDKMKKRPISPNYQGLCPFHKEKTPSFYLKPQKNMYICYGCRERGGPLSLDYVLGKVINDDILQRIEHIDKEQRKFKQILLEAWQKEPLSNTHITLLYSLP